MSIFKTKVPKMPDKYENFVRRFCGSDWRTSSQIDMDGGFGVAICKAILEGANINLIELSRILCTDPDTLAPAYERLSMNGYMKDGKIKNDATLSKDEYLAWGSIAGISGGATGVWAQ